MVAVTDDAAPAPEAPDAPRAKDPARRRASRAVALGGTLLLATAMSGCSSSGNEVVEADHDYAQVCQDTTTHERRPDEECDDDGTPGHTASGVHHTTGWYFLPLSGGRTVPAVGSPLSGGTASRPGSGSVTKVSPAGGDFAQSGTVSKGGFGTKGGGAGS